MNNFINEKKAMPRLSGAAIAFYREHGYYAPIPVMTFAADNMLTRGQEIAVDVNDSKAVMLSLRLGEMSLHHISLIHGSDPNPSERRRIGFAIRYLPSHVRQVVGTHTSATPVRGVDRFKNFQPEYPPPPTSGRMRSPSTPTSWRPTASADAQHQSRSDAMNNTESPL